MLPDRLSICLDENHCNNKRLIAVLEDAGIRVERHLKYFPRGTPDEEWLPFVGEKGWALLTTDKRIKYRANERKAVMDHRVRMFYFSKNEMNGQQMAAALLRALPEIRSICSRQEPPFFAAITRNGVVYLKNKLID